MKIRLNNDQWHGLSQHFTRSEETAAFLLSRPVNGERGDRLEVSEILYPRESEIRRQSSREIIIEGDFLGRAITRGWERGLSLVEVHSHPSSLGPAAFSAYDQQELRTTLRHVKWRTRGATYAALVVGPRGFSGLAWVGPDADKKPSKIEALIVGNRTFVADHPFPVGQVECDEQVERQVRFFGRHGQARLAGARVAIVGCGGIGSPVAQQLARLGARDFVLVDPDTVDRSSANRMIGMRAGDAEADRPKVEVVSRMIREVQPDATVRVHQKGVASASAIRDLEDRTVVFSCVDQVSARHDVNAITASLTVPLVDIATEIFPDDSFWGGRAVLCLRGDFCLTCAGEISQLELRRELLTGPELREEAALYGLPVTELGDSGPSVVFLNGVLASLSVHEWAVDVTGVREANKYFVFDGQAGVIRIDRSPPTKPCLICESVRGTGVIGRDLLLGGDLTG